MHEQPSRHGILIAGRSYHMRPELMNGMDRVMEEEGFAVIPTLGLEDDVRALARQLARPEVDRRRSWLPARHSLGIGALAASDPQLDLVCLQSFGCGIDAVSLADVQRMVEGAGRPFTLVKLDTKADPAHTRIRIRALAESIRARRSRELGEGQSSAEELLLGSMIKRKPMPHEASLRFGGITQEDAELAQRILPADICGTAALLAAHGINQATTHPGTRIQLPSPCKFCITEACQHFVALEGLDAKTEWVSDWPGDDFPAKLPPLPQGAPRLGLSGNPLLLFDPIANQGADAFLRSHGVQPVYPAPETWYSDRDHYLPQLESLAEQGVSHVLLLQSFLCLKTHVYVRGALPTLRMRFPGMGFTVVDIDPQASPLNVYNRVLLAIEELRP
ncbi:MAG: hypothetical protein ACI36Y_07270 [Coriobacteriales bacterium]